MSQNKTKKSKWGIGILVLYSGFVLFILSFVILATQNNYTLVEDNYYQKAISFQDKIDKQKNTIGLKIKPLVQFDNKENRIVITFPDSLAKIGITGRAHFFRPSNKRADQNFPIDLDTNSQMIVSSTRFLKGAWILKLSWESSKTSYYQENNLTIRD